MIPEGLSRLPLTVVSRHDFSSTPTHHCAQSPFYSIAQPLAETINRTFKESSWYYITPGILSLESLFQALPNHLKKGIVNAMPALWSKSSVTRKLFTSRLKKETYSVASEDTIDPTTLDAS